MTEAQEKSPDWAQAWIDEQRERLENSLREGTVPSGDRDLGALLSRLGADWLSSYELLARASFPKSTVPLGWAREQEREWRDLASAQAEYRRLEAQIVAKLLAVHARALDRLQQAVRERTEQGRPFEEFRELYDLWIECGEEIYAEVARSEEYCRLQAALGNASIELRARQQKVLERGLKYFDLPTRSELNSVHRELRALRERLAELEVRLPRQAPSANNTTRATRARASQQASKRTSKRASK